MTLKELAHAAQKALQSHAGCQVRRSHVHELLAAAFGSRSWAAFLTDSLLADAGVGEAPSGASPRVIGRAVQLGYSQQAALALARSLLEFVAEHQISSVSWSVLGAALFAPPWCDIPPGNPQGLAAPLAPLLRRAMDNGRVSATLYTGPWTDVGTPQRLEELNASTP